MSSPRSVAECPLSLRALPHIAPTQRTLVASRTRTLGNSSWRGRGGGWSQVGLWQTASHSHLSQLGFCLSLQSDPSPAGNQEPLASCPALHSAELAEPILPAGVLGGPPCTQILSLWCRLSTLPVLCLP